MKFQGCDFAFELAGCGPPILLLQGVGVHGSGWRPQVEGLLDAYQCLSFDNRGIGASQPATVPITLQQMVDDGLALLDHVGWPSTHVIGHSLGGPVSAVLAASAPQRVRSLSVLCTFARGRDVAPSACG